MVCMQTAPLVPTPATRDEISSPPSSSDGTDVPLLPNRTSFPSVFNFPTLATPFRDLGERITGVVPTSHSIRSDLPSSTISGVGRRLVPVGQSSKRRNARGNYRSYQRDTRDGWNRTFLDSLFHLNDSLLPSFFPFLSKKTKDKVNKR